MRIYGRAILRKLYNLCRAPAPAPNPIPNPAMATAVAPERAARPGGRVLTPCGLCSRTQPAPQPTPPRPPPSY